MAHKSVLISLCLLLNIQAFSDTIVCCNSDTLTLAYEYDDILYFDSCDIQINDILVISPDHDVFIQIIPIDTSFNFWLSIYEPHTCPPTSCEFDNYITKITGDGIFRAYEYNTIKYETYFEVIIGNSDDMQFLLVPSQGNPPVYDISVNNDFEYYYWSNGSTSNYFLVDQPGNYTINTTNHCGQTFENNINISASGFVEGQFYTNQKTGDNVSYIDLEPDSTAHFFHGGSVPPFKDFYFDINQDQVDDLYFDIDFASANGGYSASFYVTPLNGCEVLTINNPLAAMNIDENCVINDVYNFSLEENMIMFKDGWIGFTAGCSAGLWQDSDNYLGFRIPVINDTLYGWMHISFFTSWGELSLIIDDYAYNSTSNQIVQENLSKKVSIYPNPASSELFIKTELPDYKVELLDIMGTSIFTGKEPERIELSYVPKGMYILKVSSGDEEFFQKIIKQ